MIITDNDSLTPDQQERYNELYDQAVSRYLDKTDFDISEWLSDEEYKEFQSYQDIINPR